MNLNSRHMRLEHSSDAELMREIALGSQDAQKHIMDRYIVKVSRISYRMLCDRMDSEHVTREAFMTIWKDASAYDGRDSIHIWLYRIVWGLCFRRLIRRRILDILSIRPDVYESSVPAPMSPEEDFITKETWAVFCRASLELSPKQRAVYTFMELEGLSSFDVASITGMSTDRVRSNLRIARERVKQELQRYGRVR